MEQRLADKPADQDPKTPAAKPSDAPRPMDPGLTTASPIVHQALAQKDDAFTPGAMQHAEKDPPQPGKALLERYAFDVAKSRFTRHGARYEVHGYTDSGKALVTRLEDSQPKNLMLMDPPKDDGSEDLSGPDEA